MNESMEPARTGPDRRGRIGRLVLPQVIKGIIAVLVLYPGRASAGWT
jgi:hypothetical protein